MSASSLGPQDLIADISAARSAWSGPNERTATVDAAVVRVARALDAAALHHQGKRPKRLEVVVDSAAGSVLEFEVTSDGRWSFEDGAWDADGLRHRSRLLRPTLRGIARATRPDFERAVDAVVRDVELACAGRIALDDDGSGPTGDVPVDQTVDELLESAFPELSSADAAALRLVAGPVDAGAGTILMVKGAPGTEALFLLGGRVAVETSEGHVVLGPGSVVGERAPLTGRPRDATVRALTDVVLLVIAANALAELPDSIRSQLGNKVRV